MLTIRNARRGFTFLEIMLVVLIIGILVSIVVPQFGGRTEQARKQATLLSIHNTAQQINLFEVDYGYYPETLDELVDPPEPPMGGDPRPYLDELPTDSWRNVLVYNPESEIAENRRSYDLYSMGRNGTDDGGEDDDIVPWNTEEDEDL